MENNISFSITNDSVAVIIDGKVTNVRKGAPNFVALRNALIAEDWAAVTENLTVKRSLADWAKGAFTIEGDVVSFNGAPLPASLNSRVVEMATRGESPEPLFNFWERLQRNPSHHSVTQLWNFLNHVGIPLTPDGCFLAYKGVNNDLTDKYTGKLDNHPGAVHEMARNLVSDDPHTACHYGFHVGALEYARGFGAVVVICKVDPEFVVSVPADYSFQKMRVCRYSVEGYYGSQLPDTTLDEQYEDDEDEDEDAYETCGYCGSMSDDEQGCIDGDTCNTEGEGGSLRPIPKTAEGEDATDSDLAEGNVVHGEDSFEAPAEPKRIAKKWERLSRMSTAELMDQPIARLRAYAGKGLKIVGATKIPGGKASLIMRILDVRDR